MTAAPIFAHLQLAAAPPPGLEGLRKAEVLSYVGDGNHRALFVLRGRERRLPPGVSVLAETAQATLFALDRADFVLPDLIAHHDCVLVGPIVVREASTDFDVLAPARANLRRLVDEIGGDVVVDGIVETDLSVLEADLHLGRIVTNLTPRQVSVFTAAWEKGYYEIPRRCGTEELAERFDCARSTAEEHLRKAERQILGTVGRTLHTTPMLSDAAGKKRGRPPSVRGKRARSLGEAAARAVRK